MKVLHNNQDRDSQSEMLEEFYDSVLTKVGVSIRAEFQKFVAVRQQAVRQQPCVVTLDFSARTLTRHQREPFSMPGTLSTQMLEQLTRGPVLPAAQFALLFRSKSSGGYGDDGRLMSSLRHELSELRRMIREFDLPIRIEREDQRIRAFFDRAAIQTNVWQGQMLGKNAFALLRKSDLAGATAYARQALQVDFDCAVAAWVVARVLQAEDQPNADIMLSAQICVARAIYFCVGAIRRLRGFSRSDRVLAQARHVASRRLAKLREQWKVLRSWFPDDAHLSDMDCQDCFATKELLEVWMDAISGNTTHVYDRFANNSIIIGVVDQLLARRLRRATVQQRKEMAERLTADILEKLIMNAWLPVPVGSQLAFREQIIRFLRRRIDWEMVLNRSGTCRAFRDLQIKDDGDDSDVDE